MTFEEEQFIPGIDNDFAQEALTAKEPRLGIITAQGLSVGLAAPSTASESTSLTISGPTGGVAVALTQGDALRLAGFLHVVATGMTVMEYGANCISVGKEIGFMEIFGVSAEDLLASISFDSPEDDD